MASHTQRVLRTTRILANFQIRPENNNPYNTRNQEKMNKDGIVRLHFNTNKFEINKLLNGMNESISGINYFGNNIHRSFYNIQIRYNPDHNSITIYGKNGTLFSFLNHPIALKLINAKWLDITQPIYQINPDHFNLLFKKKSFQESYGNDCPICLDSFKINDEIVITQCNHLFHKQCLKTWLYNSSEPKHNCPYCRNNFLDEII